MLVSKETKNKHKITNLLGSEINPFSITVASCGSNHPCHIQRNSLNICCSIIKTQHFMPYMAVPEIGGDTPTLTILNSELVFVASTRFEKKDDPLVKSLIFSYPYLIICKVTRTVYVPLPPKKKKKTKKNKTPPVVTSCNVTTRVIANCQYMLVALNPCRLVAVNTDKIAIS